MSKEVLYQGPDISKHNGNVDIKRVRDAGYKRIGIRAGYAVLVFLRADRANGSGGGTVLYRPGEKILDKLPDSI